MVHVHNKVGGRSPGTRVCRIGRTTPTKGSHLRVAVMGTPCGATTYLAAKLRAGGLDVPHERLGDDGIVCGLWTLPVAARSSRDVSRPRIDDYVWDHNVILVRHPILVAETAPKIIEQEKDLLWYDTDPRVNSLRYWVLAHEAALMQMKDPLIVRADNHFAADCATLANLLKIEDNDPGQCHRNSKSSRWPRMTWSEWCELDPTFALRGNRLIVRYGLDDI